MIIKAICSLDGSIFGHQTFHSMKKTFVNGGDTNLIENPANTINPMERSKEKLAYKIGTKKIIILK